MTRKLLFLTLAVVVPAIAAAQEPRGAQRTEIGTALFGGGVLVTPGLSEDVTNNYVLSVAVARNVSHWIGLEGDIGVAFGRHETREVPGPVPSNRKTPNMLLYSGNLIYNPFRSDRPFVPYLSAGFGGLKVFHGIEADDFALGTDTTHATGSVGGGVRWFPITHWGLRGDYRYLHIANDTPAPNGRAPVHQAHRFYGALIVTF